MQVAYWTNDERRVSLRLGTELRHTHLLMSPSMSTEAQSWPEGFGNFGEVLKFRKLRCSIILHMTVMLRTGGQDVQWTSGGWLFKTCKPMQRAIAEIGLLQ